MHEFAHLESVSRPGDVMPVAFRLIRRPDV